MALQKDVKITVFESEPYSFTGTDGQVWEGFTTKGFDSENRVHTFTSKRQASPVYNVGGYDDRRVQHFVLEGRIWNDKTKWREVTE